MVRSTWLWPHAVLNKKHTLCETRNVATGNKLQFYAVMNWFHIDLMLIYLSILDDIWVEHRKFLEESFELDIIKTFLSIFADSSNQMLASLDQIEDKEKVDIFKLTSRCALTMVLATSFGVQANEVHFSDDIIKAVEQ